MKIWIRPLIAMTCCALIILGIPVIAWMMHWTWKPDTQSVFVWLFYLLTQTVSWPYGVVTAFLLTVAILLTLNVAKKDVLRVCLILLFPIIIGQLVIGQIKQITHEPRPYVVWLTTVNQAEMQHFYDVAPGERRALISTTLGQRSRIPLWQMQHWQSQTDYAFPSGHTVFAATWALISVGVMSSRRRYFLPAIIIIWSVGVIVSRLLLGVHWPRDVVASLIIAVCFSLPTVYGLLRYQPASRPVSGG